MVGQPGLRRDPVLDGDQGEISAVALAGLGPDRQRTGRTVATAQVVDPDDEELVGIERLAGPDQVVPPADVLGIVSIEAGDVMAASQRMADQHGVGTFGVERAIGLVSELETG